MHSWERLFKKIPIQEPLTSVQMYPVVTVYTQLPPKKPEQGLIILAFIVISALVDVSFFSSIPKNYKKKNLYRFL